MSIKLKAYRANSLISCLIALVIVTSAVLTYSAWIQFMMRDTEKLWQEMPTPDRATAGFSLLECLLSLAISLVVLANCLSLFGWFHQATLKLREVQIVTQEAMFLKIFFARSIAMRKPAEIQVMSSEVFNNLQLTRKSALSKNAVLRVRTAHTTRYYFVAETMRKTREGNPVFGLYQFTLGSDTQELSEQVSDFQISINKNTDCWQFNLNFSLPRARSYKIFSWVLCNRQQIFL